MKLYREFMTCVLLTLLALLTFELCGTVWEIEEYIHALPRAEAPHAG